MKLSAIFLITLNLWGSFFCCCQDLVCSAQTQMACHSETMAEAASLESSCHGAQRLELQDSGCHETSGTTQASPVAPNPSVSSNLAPLCNCGSHTVRKQTFTVPNSESPLFITWKTSAHPALVQASFEIKTQILQTPGRTLPTVARVEAPSLSALGRFLI